MEQTSGFLTNDGHRASQPLIVVVGGSGFVGRHLISALLKKTQYRVRAVARDIERLKIRDPRLEARLGDAGSRASMSECMRGATAVYYLVHKLESKAGDLFSTEAKVATEFSLAVKEAGVKRVIYLSGLGSDADKLSRHLASRHNTGDIFRRYVPEVIEFRAGIIIGQGSISYEIIKYLIDKLPVLFLPKQAKTMTQPIGINDVTRYLLAGLELSLKKSVIIEIGGPDKMNYQELLKRYAKFAGKSRWIACVPFLPLRLAGWCLYLLTPKSIAQVGRNMVDSFQNQMIVTDESAKELFPAIEPQVVLPLGMDSDDLHN